MENKLSDNDLKLIDDIDKMYKTGAYKANKNKSSRLLSSDTKSWILSVTGISTVAALVYLVAHYETTLWVILAICGLAMLGVLVYGVKQLIKMWVFDDYGDDDNDDPDPYIRLR